MDVSARFITTVRRLGVIGVVAVLMGVLIGPGGASAGVNGNGPQQWDYLTQPFSQFGDSLDYYMTYGGTCEANYSCAWKLGSGVGSVPGNEPWKAHWSGDGYALQINSGATATTLPFPIKSADHLRFFVKPSSTKGSVLKIHLVAMGNESYNLYKPLKSSNYVMTAGANVWTAGPFVPVPMALGPDGLENLTMSFTVSGGGTWLIDDIYMDPQRWR